MSDVMATGWHAAVSAGVGAGMTVAVVGDGAVGLSGVLAAAQLGADRVIAMEPETLAALLVRLSRRARTTSTPLS
jgi:threonine dehydrogenase-like Zn-dependent dehydrogenase